MKKNLLAAILAGLLALGAVACGGGDDADTGGTATEGTVPTEAVTP